MKIEVLDRGKLDILIESVSDPENVWGMERHATCFCGHAHNFLGCSIDEILSDFEHALDNLIMPKNWRNEGDPRYSRDNAIRVLESIRDTGEFEW